MLPAPCPAPALPTIPHPTPPSIRYGTLVAAKILKGSNEIALGDFRGEIEILRRVHHPNAVQVGFLPFCCSLVFLAAFCSRGLAVRSSFCIHQHTLPQQFLCSSWVPAPRRSPTSWSRS